MTPSTLARTQGVPRRICIVARPGALAGALLLGRDELRKDGLQMEGRSNQITCGAQAVRLVGFI